MSENSRPPFIYMNNAATSYPKPPSVLAAVNTALSKPFFGSGRTTEDQGEDYPSLARQELAHFFKVGPFEHVVFTQNATEALNLLIQGFVSAEGDRFHVISTALEHNSVLRPLNELERQHRITLTVLPSTHPSIEPAVIQDAIQPKTRLVVMTHGSNVLGSVQDIRSIGKILKEQDIFFIADAAQTAGHLPIDLGTLPVDALVFTGHKGLFGLPGTGGFFIRDPERVAPTKFGGTGTESYSTYHPREMPERFEAGTLNYPGLASLAAGIQFINSVGIDHIGKKAQRQTSLLIHELQKEPTIVVYNKHPDLPIVAFNIQGMKHDDVGFILARVYHIIARTGLHCAPLMHQVIEGWSGCVRLSLSWFTTNEECRIAADAIRGITRHADSKVGSP